MEILIDKKWVNGLNCKGVELRILFWDFERDVVQTVKSQIELF